MPISSELHLHGSPISVYSIILSHYNDLSKIRLIFHAQSRKRSKEHLKNTIFNSCCLCVSRYNYLLQCVCTICMMCDYYYVERPSGEV